MKSLWITNSVAVTVPASVISELSSLPQIASIELDAVIEAPLIEPSDDRHAAMEHRQGKRPCPLGRRH